MEHSHKFFRNTSCRFFPCHAVEDDAHFNCLFCYCPLYPSGDCGGCFSFTENGVKDCSACTLPHKAENYDYILDKLAGK